MPDINVPWGAGELSVPIPDTWELLQTARPEVRTAAANWQERMGKALGTPVAGESLPTLLKQLGKGRLVIVVEDLTRHSPLAKILEILMREIRHAGVPDEQMEIFIGAGMHPPAEADAVEAKLGPAVAGIPWRWNPWHDENQYVTVGRHGTLRVQIAKAVADADLRIIVTSVSPHLQAGFGGGYKMYFPGCGLIRSIRMLHRRGIDRRNQRQLVGMNPEANPMRKVIDAAGRMVDQRHGTTFSVQYLLDAEDQPTSLAAGEPLATHRMVTKQCAVACGVLPAGQADILVTNAHPRDHDLWQAFKCIPNTIWAARPNGVVICLARCPAGLNEMKTMRWPLSPSATRKLVQWLGPNTICSLLDRIVKELAGDSQWFIRLATQILERNPIYMVSPNLVQAGARFPGIALFEDVESALAAADRHLSKGPRRVAIYPEGGATYPVIRANGGARP